MPSITECGSPSSTLLSMYAPGSPSSPLQITNFPVAERVSRKRPLEARWDIPRRRGPAGRFFQFFYGLLRR